MRSQINLEALKNKLGSTVFPIELQKVYDRISREIDNIETKVKKAETLANSGNYKEAVSILIDVYNNYTRLFSALDDMKRLESTAVSLLSTIDDLEKEVQNLKKINIDTIIRELPSKEDFDKARQCVYSMIVGEKTITECNNKINNIEDKLRNARNKLFDYVKTTKNNLRSLKKYITTTYLSIVSSLSRYCSTTEFTNMVENIQNTITKLENCYVSKDVLSCIQTLQEMVNISKVDIDSKYNTLITSCIATFETEKANVLKMLNESLSKVQDLLGYIEGMSVSIEMKQQCSSLVGQEKCTIIIRDIERKYRGYKGYKKELEGIKKDLENIQTQLSKIKSTSSSIKKDFDTLYKYKGNIEVKQKRIQEIEKYITQEVNTLSKYLRDLEEPMKTVAEGLLNEKRLADFRVYVNILSHTTTEHTTTKQQNASLYIIPIVIIISVIAGALLYLKKTNPEKYKEIISKIQELFDKLRGSSRDKGEYKEDGEYDDRNVESI